MNRAPTEVLISVRDLVVGFDRQIVLDHLALDVHRGEILGVVGASGSGKSVLLRTVIGLLPKRQGTITFAGSDRADGAAEHNGSLVARRWGILFQQGALFSSLTVRQNIQFPMRESLELSDALLDELATAKLEIVGLDARARACAGARSRPRFPRRADLRARPDRRRRFRHAD
jgi:phospholipid/cholesterol/gamma-HCH transport system ATP-binding protein